MTAEIHDLAEQELEQAFEHYERQRPGLGRDLLHEFRRGVDRILQFPQAWRPLDATHRCYRLHRFPFGLVYRVDEATDKILIVCVMHFSRAPGAWKGR